ncbi:pentapeptide repeat-containing protein [Actinosynnema sp. NPDC047251]|uniref:pentapeptide repeat-containing protein n=1 Tax=Saccharothrix espanaensis TaxID=103731 RepID=UPI00031E8176|nr:pentapeptide repeat-containing protein [Saccharothrix espanaensis]
MVFTGLSLQATREQNAVTEQGQLTDRFTKAVDQLDRIGADHLQARLGGIYALERLARDSPRDHPTVIEALSAYVRSTTPRRPNDPGTPGYAPCPEQPAVDVQAALTVLGRRDTGHDQGTRVDLTETCLGRAKLAGADLDGADLADADLGGADLGVADFTGADLRGANLSRAYLEGAVLAGADIYSAYLTGTNLRGANLEGANLTDANLTSANLTDAYLEGAVLAGANLTDTRR